MYGKRGISYKSSEHLKSTNLKNNFGVFQYTEFRSGVSFIKATFNDDLDIKYTKVKGEFDITNMTVSNNIDSKYTKINGKGFNKHLLDSKN